MQSCISLVFSRLLSMSCHSVYDFCALFLSFFPYHVLSCFVCVCLCVCACFSFSLFLFSFSCWVVLLTSSCLIPSKSYSKDSQLPWVSWPTSFPLLNIMSLIKHNRHQAHTFSISKPVTTSFPPASEEWCLGCLPRLTLPPLASVSTFSGIAFRFSHLPFQLHFAFSISLPSTHMHMQVNWGKEET